MGWTVWYQFVRADAPSTEEVAALAAAAAEANATPWDSEPFRLTVRRAPAGDGVIVDGASKLAMNLEESDDGHRMVAAINAALAAVPGAALRLHDDLEILGIEDGRCSFDGAPPAPPIEIDRDELVAIEALVPRRVALPDELSRALADRAGGALAGGNALAGAAATVIEQALVALSALDPDDPRRQAVLAWLDDVPPLERARVGLDGYAVLGRLNATREHLGVAVDLVEDVGPLVPAFVAAWEQPTGLYHYGDMPWTQATRDRFARRPEVIARMEADLAAAERDDSDDELPWRRAEHATEYLGRSGHPRAIAALIAVVRRWRGRQAPWRLRSYLLQHARKALGDFPHPRAGATLLLELAGCRPSGHPRDAMLRGLARLEPRRASPILRQACERQAGMRGVVEALAAAATPEAAAMLDSLRGYPHRGTRGEIAWQDRRSDRDRREEPALPPPEALIAHPDAEVRQDALEALIARGDRALFTTLLHAEALHRGLQLRHEDASSGPSWRLWEEQALVPAAILRASIDRRLAWAEAEAAAHLGAQTHLDALASVRSLGVAAVVSGYPDPRLILTAEQAARLLEEEDGNLRALRA